jgi:hypothetical protein
MNANLNRALLSYTDRNGHPVTIIANDDRRMSPDQMQHWVDSMNRAAQSGSRFYLG